MFFVKRALVLIFILFQTSKISGVIYVLFTFFQHLEGNALLPLFSCEQLIQVYGMLQLCVFNRSSFKISRQKPAREFYRYLPQHAHNIVYIAEVHNVPGLKTASILPIHRPSYPIHSNPKNAFLA